MSEAKDKKDVLQGTLALMVLKTLHVLGPCTAMESRGGLSRSAETSFSSTKERSIRSS